MERRKGLQIPAAFLERNDWSHQRRFTVDERRAKEVMELYTQMGYEVRVEPMRAEELQDGCHDCQTSASLRLREIHTRER